MGSLGELIDRDVLPPLMHVAVLIELSASEEEERVRNEDLLWLERSSELSNLLVIETVGDLVTFN